MKNKGYIILITSILVVAFCIVELFVQPKNEQVINENPKIKENNEEPKEIVKLIETLSFSDTTKKIEVKTNYQTNITYEPVDAINKEIYYYTETPNICTISNKGLITAINVGICKIYARTINDIKTDFSIEVINSRELKNISVQESNYTIEVGKETSIPIILEPSNAEYKKITCESLNTTLFESNNDNTTCKLKGIKSGNSTLKIKVDSKEINLNIKVIKKELVSFATFNIGRGSKIKNLTYKSFGNYLKDIDIIGLQEAKDRTSKPSTLVKNIANYINKNYYYGSIAPAGNSIISKYNFISSTETKLPSPNEQRTIIKSVFNINDVNISFYNTHIVVSKHEGGSCTYNNPDIKKCPYRVKELKEINKMIQSDPNPVVILADWNFVGDQYFSLLGDNLEMVAYDTIRNKTYDSIWMIPKGKLEKVDNTTVKTKDVVTDHNLVIAKINIIN